MYVCTNSCLCCTCSYAGSYVCSYVAIRVETGSASLTRITTDLDSNPGQTQIGPGCDLA